MKLFPLATTQLANSFRIWTRVAFVFGVFLYALMLQKFYAIYGPLFTYLGMVYEPQDDYIYIFAMSIAMFIATILPLDYKKPSVIFLHLLFIMSYIPINVVYSLNKYASTSALLAYSLFFVIFSVTYLISLPSFKIKKNFINQRVFFGLIWLIIFISLFFLVMKYGTNVNVKSFDDIYETRDAFKEETAGSRFYVVIFNWLSHVFAIFLLLYAIYRKHFIFIILASMPTGIYS